MSPNPKEGHIIFIDIIKSCSIVVFVLHVSNKLIKLRSNLQSFKAQ